MSPVFLSDIISQVSVLIKKTPASIENIFLVLDPILAVKTRYLTIADKTGYLTIAVKTCYLTIAVKTRYLTIVVKKR